MFYYRMNLFLIFGAFLSFRSQFSAQISKLFPNGTADKDDEWKEDEEDEIDEEARKQMLLAFMRANNITPLSEEKRSDAI